MSVFMLLDMIRFCFVNVCMFDVYMCIIVHIKSYDCEGFWSWNRGYCDFDSADSFGSSHPRWAVYSNEDCWRLIWGIFKLGFEISKFLWTNKYILQGVTFPCIHMVWSKWAPPSERSRMATLGFAGTYVGTVVAMPVSGVLASSLGWESVFYFFGKNNSNLKWICKRTQFSYLRCIGLSLVRLMDVLHQRQPWQGPLDIR